MKVLLTGASGQLGRAFLEMAPSEFEVIPVGHKSNAGAAGLELEDNAQIGDVVASTAPDWIIHTAAMTDVDGCERDPAQAHRVNALATESLARTAAAAGARMIFVSTDYVFDGNHGNYVEADSTNPQSAYGRSKLEGERLGLAALPTMAIARTSVVYGPHKKNFVTWALGELRAGKPIRIVEDQRVNPTLTYDLSEQLMALVRQSAEGIWHTAGSTSLSRLEMVREIANVFDLDFDLVTPIKSSDLQWLAPRPRDSTLNVQKIANLKPPMTFTAALGRLKETLPP